MLPIHQAFYLPIFIYTETKFRSLDGEIKIKGKVYPNMIHIGDNTRYVTTSKPLSIWTINGTLIFEGRINFIYGTYVYVAKNAICTFGTDGTFLGCNSKVICFESIKIGNHVGITWENQIYDTSFHYTTKDGEEPKSLTKPVIIGDNVWIGNRSTICKGAIIPSYSIIASNSLINKDLRVYGEYCLFAGSPAMLKSNNIKRIYDIEEEKKLDDLFNYNRYKL